MSHSAYLFVFKIYETTLFVRKTFKEIDALVDDKKRKTGILDKKTWVKVINTNDYGQVHFNKMTFGHFMGLE